MSGGRSATFAPIGLALGFCRLRPIAGDQVGKVLLALSGFLKRLIAAGFAIVPGAGEQIAKRGGRILPADVAVVFGGHCEQSGQHAEVPPTIFVAAAFEFAGRRRDLGQLWTECV